MNERNRFDELIAGEARRHYNVPGDTPRKEIWAGIREARPDPTPRQAPSAGEESGTVPGWARWAMGMAAALLLGIGLGRMTVMQESGVTPGSPGSERVADARAGGEAGSGPTEVLSPTRDVPTAYRLATVDALDRADVVLTSFRSEAGAGRITEQTTEWARDLLGTTRLLMDSPASRDPQMKSLLRDLELVLAQIANLSTGSDAPESEVELVTEAVDHKDVLTKVRLMSSEALSRGADE